MPKKGGTLACGKRTSIVDRKMFSQFKKENPDIQLNYIEYKHLCEDANLVIADCILKEPLGFKVPFFGQICITRYKSKKKAVDANASRIYGKEIPHTNMHTLGYRFAIRFFKVTGGRKNNSIYAYLFKADRKLKRTLAKKLKETGGEEYLNLRSNAFVTKSKVSKYVLNNF